MNMLTFLTYEGKAALSLLVFYLFYRFLLKKETFHRFNRIVLVGTAVLSFLLPLCIITIRKPVESLAVMVGDAVATGMAPAANAPVAASQLWWPQALFIIFLIGVAFVLVRLIVSVFSIVRIVRGGEVVGVEDGCKIIVTERDINPFSWMHYIVLSRNDWEGPHASIITHEKAHISYGHSVDLLLVDIMSAFQWFNPAIWILRADLQELHEYEADDTVLRSGIDIKDYQYLLIRKAVSKSGYSVANSFNHSILKKRITMMSKSKSPLLRGLRALYLLPLICLGIGLQAKTVYTPAGKNDKKAQESVKIVLRQAWGEEKVISQSEFDKLDKSRISSVDVITNADAAAKEKYGLGKSGAVILVTLKRPQELDEVVVVRYGEKKGDEAIPFMLANPDTMPKFQGGDMNNFSRWLNQRIMAPVGCKHSGTMKIKFTVGVDGSVSDVQIAESICEELDATMLNLVSKSPKWEPATNNGVPVAQEITIPVVFMIR